MAFIYFYAAGIRLCGIFMQDFIVTFLLEGIISLLTQARFSFVHDRKEGKDIKHTLWQGHRCPRS